MICNEPAGFPDQSVRFAAGKTFNFTSVGIWAPTVDVRPGKSQGINPVAVTAGTDHNGRITGGNVI